MSAKPIPREEGHVRMNGGEDIITALLMGREEGGWEVHGGLV